MKKIRRLIILWVMGCISAGCTYDRAPYDHILDLAEKQNLAFDSITNLDSIKMAVAFFDDHGTANEQIRAYYLLGCAYRDMGDAPNALDNYQNAVNCADTTRTDCNYQQLANVHAQMSGLFYEQLLPYEQLTELKLYYKYSVLANNWWSAINAIEHKADVYELLNQKDSVIQIRQNVLQLYKQYGYEKEAALSVGTLIDKLLDMNKISEAKHYINIYEKGIEYNDIQIIEKRRVIYYYIKGKYYLAINKLDSAKYLFQQLLDPSLNGTQLEAGYRGLYLYYKKIGQSDSLAKYADLSYQLNDSCYALTTMEKMQHMQALYNYNRSQKEANVMKERAARNKLMLMTALAILALVLMIGSYIYQKRRRETEKLLIQYDNAKANLEKAKTEMARMEAENNSLLQEKIHDISMYEQQIQEYEKKLNIVRKKVTNEELMTTAIYNRFKFVLAHPKENLQKKDWNSLRKMMDEKIPHFYSEIHTRKARLQQQDYDICILVRLFFTPSEIAILTNNNPSNISMKRIRLLKRIFGIDGSPEEFDKRIQNIC